MESNFGLVRYTLTRFFADQGLLEPNRRLAKTDRLLRCVTRLSGEIWTPSKGTKESFLETFLMASGLKIRLPLEESGLPADDWKDRLARAHPAPKRPVSSAVWKRVRYLSFRKNGYRCQCCGKTSGVMDVSLHVDHIKPRSMNPDLLLDLDNTQILCRECNARKGISETDYRRIQ